MMAEQVPLGYLSPHVRHSHLGANDKKLIGRSLLEVMETWIRSDLLPPHSEDALV